MLKDKSILKAIIFCLVISIWITVYINDDGLDYIHTKMHLSDFSQCYDCIISDDGKTVATTGKDPQICFELDEQYIKKLTINSTELPNKWNLQIFYAATGEKFTEDKSIYNTINKFSNIIDININKKAKLFRIDFGDLPNQTFVIDHIEIYSAILNPDRSDAIYYWFIRPFKNAGLDMYAKALMLFAILVTMVLIANKINTNNSLNNSVFISFFCAIIIFLIININHANNAPRLWNKNGKLDFISYTDAYEDYLDKNIGFRKKLIDLNALVHYKILGISNNEDVALGKSDWLFYTGNNNIEIAKNSYPMINENYIDTAKSLQEVSDYFERQGIHFLFISTSSKPSIYPEYLAGNYGIIDTPSTKLCAAIAQYTKTDFICLKDALLAEKNNSLLYYKTDSHWNELGTLIGYKTIYNSMIKKGYLDGEFPETKIISGFHNGDLGDMMASNIIIPNEAYEHVIVSSPHAKLILNGQEYETLKALKTKCGFASFSIFKNDSFDGKKVLIFGDSFFGASGDTNIIDLMCENCSELVYIWNTEINQDIVNFVQPNTIIYECGEREIQYINNRLQKFISKNIME